MARYKANVSFSGLVKMQVGEIKEITDKNVINDLLKAGYIEEIKETKKKTATKKEK